MLLAPDDGALDVTVVSAPGRLTPGGSPDRAACLPSAPAVFPVNSTIDVALDPSLPSTRIRDAGAHGPATPLPPSPGP